MLQNKRLIVLLAGLVLSGFTACGKTGEEAAAVKEPVSYGSSVNMRNGGLTAADESALYYVWDNALYRITEQGTDSELLDPLGADSLCLTPQGLYYGSYDEQGNRGIYFRDPERTERTLVYRTDFTSLYEAEGLLYFLEQGNISAVSIDGSNYRVLYEGDYEALSAEGSLLYFKDQSTGAYYRKQMGEETVSDADILIADTGDSLPVLSDGWIYYDSGSWRKTNRVRTDGSDPQELEGNTGGLPVQGKYSYAQTTRMNWETGETDAWTDQAGVRLVGLAGERLVYEACTYAPENLTEAYPVPRQVRLVLFDTTGEQEEMTLQEKQDVNRFYDTEEAERDYAKLMSGNRTLLRSPAEGFFEALEQEKDQVRYLLVDADGDQSPELYVSTQTADYVFHASADGIYCWLVHENREEERLEPMEKGAFLYRKQLRQEGIEQTVYDIYRFLPGGEMQRVDSYQHLKLDPAALHIDRSAEGHVKKDTYYAGEEFVSAAQWEKAVEENVTAQLVPEAQLLTVKAVAQNG